MAQFGEGQQRQEQRHGDEQPESSSSHCQVNKKQGESRLKSRWPEITYLTEEHTQGKIHVSNLKKFRTK